MPRKRRPPNHKNPPLHSLPPTDHPTSSSSSSHNYDSTTNLPIQNVSNDPQTSSNLFSRLLPLNWNKLDCYLLSEFVHEYSFDFKDSKQWWSRCTALVPTKTIQDMRHFIILYYKNYGELPPTLLLSEAESVQGLTLGQLETKVLGETATWTVEEKEKLAKQVRKRQKIMTSRECWKILAAKFPGKKRSDVMMQVAKMKFDAVFAGLGEDVIPEMKDSRSSVRDVLVAFSVEDWENVAKRVNDLGRNTYAFDFDGASTSGTSSGRAWRGRRKMGSRR